MTGTTTHSAARTRAAELHRMKYHLDRAIENLAAFDAIANIKARAPGHRPTRRSSQGEHTSRASPSIDVPSAA